jgi:hypothetical protein
MINRNRFTRGWIVTLTDGTLIFEGEMPWKEVPKISIQSLTLMFDGRRWDLSNKQAYLVKNRISVAPGREDSARVEKRTIGYYEGATKVFYSVDENTGRFTMTTETLR